MLKYTFVLYIVLAIALPDENTIGQRLGSVTWDLIGGDTFSQIGSTVQATFTTAAEVLHGTDEAERNG